MYYVHKFIKFLLSAFREKTTTKVRGVRRGVAYLYRPCYIAQVNTILIVVVSVPFGISFRLQVVGYLYNHCQLAIVVHLYYKL